MYVDPECEYEMIFILRIDIPILAVHIHIDNVTICRVQTLTNADALFVHDTFENPTLTSHAFIRNSESLQLLPFGCLVRRLILNALGCLAINPACFEATCTVRGRGARGYAGGV